MPSLLFEPLEDQNDPSKFVPVFGMKIPIDSLFFLAMDKSPVQSLYVDDIPIYSIEMSI